MDTSASTIGVLALQGDFEEHLAVLHSCGEKGIRVRTPRELAECRALILPGGESTAISKLLTTSGLREAITLQAAERGLPIYGTCAGAILLSTEVNNAKGVESLELLDIAIDRNAYGSQTQSFQTDLHIIGVEKPVHVSFIRAPIITRAGSDVEILAEHEENSVLVRQGNIFASTFHAELHSVEVHSLFLSQL